MWQLGLEVYVERTSGAAFDEARLHVERRRARPPVDRGLAIDEDVDDVVVDEDRPQQKLAAKVEWLEQPIVDHDSKADASDPSRGKPAAQARCSRRADPAP